MYWDGTDWYDAIPAKHKPPKKPNGPAANKAVRFIRMRRRSSPNTGRTRPPRHAAVLGSRRRFTRGRVRWAIGGVLMLLLAIAAVETSGVVTERNSPKSSSSSPPAAQPSMLKPPSVSPAPPMMSRLETEFAQLENKLKAKMGIAISAVGSGQTPISLGDWQTGSAWSTIKVPLVIAGYRAEDPPHITDAMRAAITESDNAAAESIWKGLGDPVIAGDKVEDILRPTGDPTQVESQRRRPEFTAFGQTDWSLINQLRFLAVAVCDSQNEPIFGLMGQVEPDQSWGIGGVSGTQFKGGWGPSLSGKYLVRQIGVLSTPVGKTAVAIAAEPASGAFADGTSDLTEVAKWLADNLRALPASQCSG